MSNHATGRNENYVSNLTDEELKKQFDALDLNHNGVLDLDEATVAFQNLGIPSEVGQKRWQNAMVKEFGSAKTQLNFQEFAQYIRHRDQEVNKLFNELDTNKDGFISRAELQTIQLFTFLDALKKHGYAHSPDTLNQIFSALDFDQSGEIDATEWRKILLLSPSHELEEMLSEWADVSAMGVSNIPVPPIKKHSTLEQAIKQVAIGTFAGSIAKTALAPLSRIKVIIQVAEKNQSMITAVSNIYKEGGIKSFYRGNLANILKSGPETGAKLFAFDMLKDKFASADGHLSATNRFLAGGVSSIISHAMMYPVDLVKVRLEATAHGTYSGILDCAKTIYRQEGFIPAFYRGLVPVCLSTFPSSGITLGMYNYLSERMKQKYGEKAGAKHFALASTLAALVSEAVTYPLHLAKSRLATQGSPGIAKKYNGLGDFFHKVYTTDGVRGFYRGLAPAIIKHVPSVAITMTTYDVLKNYFGISKPSKHH